MPKLSILIPSRKEEFLDKTVEDILLHAEGEIEILVGIDGADSDLSYIKPDNKIVIAHREEVAIGQRAMTNKLAQLSTGDFLMKIDAHCSFSQGFDVQLLKDIKDKEIMAPAMMNLRAYDWVCLEHKRTYQGKPCCTKALKEIVWQPKPKPVMSNYVFDERFFMEYAKEQEMDSIVETMCLQGSAWIISRKDYFDWNICDESLGSWGCQAVELGIKAYLNGGRCVTNRNCYYAHLFRAEDDFPYDRGSEPGKQANVRLKELYGTKISPLLEKYRGC